MTIGANNRAARRGAALLARPGALMALGVALLTGVGFMLTPAFNDDLGYMLPFRSMIARGEPMSVGQWWETVCDSVAWRYANDNARLSNVLMVVLAVAPRWLQALLSTLALWAVLVLGARLGRFDMSAARSAFWVAGFTFFFPWVDQLYLFDFQLNYLWSTATMLLLVLMLDRRRGPVWLCAAVALVTALMHEVFGGTMAAGLAFMALRYRRWRNSRVWVSAGALAAGIVYLMLPRLGQSPNNYFEGREAIVAVYLAVPAAFAVTAALTRCRRGDRQLLSLLGVMALADSLFMLAVPLGPRVGAPAVTASLIGLTILLPPLRSRLMRLAAATVALTAACVHLLAVDVEAGRASAAVKSVLDLYHRDPKATLYVDMPLREEVSPLCLQKPYFGHLAHSRSMVQFYYMYGQPELWFKAVPADMADFSADKAVSVEGSASLMNYQGYLAGYIDEPDWQVTTLLTDYGSGAAAERFYCVALSEAPAGSPGRYLAWYYPDRSSVNQLFGRRIVRADMAAVR